jgi:transposase-like protein
LGTSYVPEFEKRWNRFCRPVGPSWRVNETYVNIKGQWNYLYRAVDKQGRTIDFYLSKTRGVAAAKAFFCKAADTHSGYGPTKVTLDGQNLAILRSGCSCASTHVGDE